MDFLSNFYRNVKIAVSSIGGLAASGAVITGIVIGGTGGIVLIVGGSVWIANSVFVLFDSVKVHSIIQRDVDKLKFNVDKFSAENKMLHTDVQILEKTKTDYIEQNNKLIDSVKKTETQIKKLSNLKAQYDEANNMYNALLKENKDEIDRLAHLNIVYTCENEQLSDSIENLKNIQKSINNENANLKVLIEQNKKDMMDLENIKNSYVIENDKLQKTNESNQLQLDDLKKQVDRLKDLYNNSKELIKNLADAGDIFNHFNSTLTVSVSNLDNVESDLDATAKQMKLLVDKLKETKFSELDKNNDGVITKEEFDDAVKGAK